MATTTNIGEALFSCYNASFGGKYELAGQITHLDALVNQGLAGVAECRKDPLSTHGAKTCRVLLIRMTEKGICKAHEIAEQKLEITGHFLKSLDSIPVRIKDLCRFLLKQWLKACENRESFTWEIRNQSVFLPLPQAVRETISKMNNDLVMNGLAAYASLHHNTAGPSSPTLVTCPEIQGWLLKGTGWLPEHARALGVRTAVLGEYLSYLLKGISLIQAKGLALHFFTAHNGKLPSASLRYLAKEYGVSAEVLWSWLEELESCGYVGQLNPKAKDYVLTGQVQSPEEDIVTYGGPWHYFKNPFDDVRRIENEVKSKVEKWFETGEESFQRFELRRAD